jgi:hypothetical protein
MIAAIYAHKVITLATPLAARPYLLCATAHFLREDRATVGMGSNAIGQVFMAPRLTAKVRELLSSHRAPESSQYPSGLGVRVAG